LTTLFDRAVFALVNLSVWLTRPAFVWMCYKKLGGIPDFAQPRGHSALMQWRKHFDRNPLFVTFCDKLAAREWARRKLPELQFAETMWVGTDPDAIPAHLLTPGHVVKSTIGSGRNYFPGTTKWSSAQRRRRFRRWLRPVRRLGEWGYSQARPRLFVERLLGWPDGVVDLTFRCHDGNISVAFCATSWKSAGEAATYLTRDGKPIEGTATGAELPNDVLLPGVYERAADFARRISTGTDHVRVDFIVSGLDLRLGELTVYTASGFGDEERLGVGVEIERAWLAAMDKSWFLSTRHRGLTALYANAFRRWVPKRLAELDAAGKP
jgi:hypothetical protein